MGKTEQLSDGENERAPLVEQMTGEWFQLFPEDVKPESFSPEVRPVQIFRHDITLILPPELSILLSSDNPFANGIPISLEAANHRPNEQSYALIPDAPDKGYHVSFEDNDPGVRETKLRAANEKHLALHEFDDPSNLDVYWSFDPDTFIVSAVFPMGLYTFVQGYEERKKSIEKQQEHLDQIKKLILPAQSKTESRGPQLFFRISYTSPGRRFIAEADPLRNMWGTSGNKNVQWGAFIDLDSGKMPTVYSGGYPFINNPVGFKRENLHKAYGIFITPQQRDNLPSIPKR